MTMMKKEVKVRVVSICKCFFRTIVAKKAKYIYTFLFIAENERK